MMWVQQTVFSWDCGALFDIVMTMEGQSDICAYAEKARDIEIANMFGFDFRTAEGRTSQEQRSEHYT